MTLLYKDDPHGWEYGDHDDVRLLPVCPSCREAQAES